MKLKALNTPYPLHSDYLEMMNAENFSEKMKNQLIFKKFVDSKKKKGKVNFKMVDIPDITNPKSKFIENLIHYSANHPIFSCPVVTYVLKIKWISYGKKLFLTKGLIYLFFVIFQSIKSVYILTERLSHQEEHLNKTGGFIFNFRLNLI